MAKQIYGMKLLLLCPLIMVLFLTMSGSGWASHSHGGTNAHNAIAFDFNTNSYKQPYATVPSQRVYYTHRY